MDTLPREIGGVETRSQEALGSSKTVERLLDKFSKVDEIPGNTVGGGLFELGPDKLVRIQLGGVAGETKGMEARILLQESFDGSCPMDRRAIPQKHDRASKVAQKMPEKGDHLWGPDILLRMESDQQTEPLSFRRDTYSRDCRYLGPAAGCDENGGMTPTGPGPGDVGDQEKTGLIQKSQMGSKPFGLFLYGARLSASSNEWLPRFSPVPFWSASDSSSPANPSPSKGSRYSNRLQLSGGRYSQRYNLC